MAHRVERQLCFALALLTSAVASGAGCAVATDSQPFSLLRYRGLVAPSLPPLCGEQAPPSATPGGQLWVVFTSQHCAQCRSLLQDLRGHGALLGRRKVRLVSYSIDAERCSAARLEAGRAGGWPIGVVDGNEQRSWAVRGTPTLFVLRRGAVVAKLLGRAPADRLIATLAPTESSPSGDEDR